VGLLRVGEPVVEHAVEYEHGVLDEEVTGVAGSLQVLEALFGAVG